MQCGHCGIGAPTPEEPTSTPDPSLPTATPAAPGLFYQPVGVTVYFNVPQIQTSSTGADWIGYPGQALSTFLDCGPGNQMKGAIAISTVSSVGIATKLKVFGKSFMGWDERTGVVSMVDTQWTTGYRAALYDGSGLTANVELTESDLDQYSTWIPGWVPSVLVREDSYVTANYYYVGILCYGIPYEEPEPTPEPTLPSYCNQVDDGDGSGDDLGIQLPEIVVSQAYCLQVGGQTVDLSVLNLIPGIDDIGEVAIPGFQLCYRYISFGFISLFNYSVDLDIFALLMGGIALIRIFLRS